MRCTTPLPYLSICWRDLRSSWLRWQCWCDQQLVIFTAMQTNWHKGTNPYKFIALLWFSYFSINKLCKFHLLFGMILRMSTYFYNKYLAGICNGEKKCFLSWKLKSLKRMKLISSFSKVKVPQTQAIAVYI